MIRIIKNWKPISQFSLPADVFRGNGYGRRYMSINDLPFRAEAFMAFGYDEIEGEPIFKNFIGNHFLDGAFVHEHMDTAPYGFMHVRANWMLKKPPAGGNPILDGVELQVDIGDLWICYASEERHSSVPIKGGQRTVCSFGALIKRPQNFNIKECLSE